MTRRTFFNDQDLDQRIQQAVHSFRRQAFVAREREWRKSSPWVV